MSDAKKTKKQLIEELERMRNEVSRQADNPPDGVDEPASLGNISRRTALKVAWSAPVILSIPLLPQTLIGQPSAGTVAPGCPTMSPTNTPTGVRPTLSPTLFPTTAEPTSVIPTGMPSVSPTTANPTAFTANPTTANPTTANPTTANPTTANPTTANPTTANPTTANPTTANPTTMDPTRSPTSSLGVSAPGAALPTAFPTVATSAFPAAAPAPEIRTALFRFDD